MNQPNLSPYGKLYLLLDDFNCTVKGQKVCIPEMFTFDGCSVPMFSLFKPRLIKPALVHDWLYVSHQTTRKVADKIFKALLKENGVSWFVYASMYRALRIGGGLAWKYSKADKKKLEVLLPQIKNNENFELYNFPQLK